MEIKENQLYLGGVSSVDLIDKHGSPLYVYEEGTIRDRINQLKKSITYNKLKIHYACKANTNLSIMKVLLGEGANIDAVSTGEVFIALTAGFKPEQITFTGNNVTDEEMKYLIDNDILINVDSLSQLKRYGNLNPDSNVAVRINPDVGAGHHDHCITGGSDSKFGVYFSQVDEIKKIADEFNLKVIGLHEHIGSGILDTPKFLKAMKVLLDVADKDRFPDLKFIDFGGGIGVPYDPSEKPLELAEFGKEVTNLFKNWCKDYGKELKLCIEPGRFLVCESGFLLAKVNTVKVTPHKVFVGLNTGFNHLIRPTMYGSYHEIVNASNFEGEKEKVDVCGNICESGDLFARDREISKIKEGDILAILNAGAYGFAMASNYNSRPLPAEVLVSNGKDKVIRKREEFKDLLDQQIL